MKLLRTTLAITVLAAAMLAGGYAVAAGYAVDPVHSSVYFRINHQDIAELYGRFDAVEGHIEFDAESPEKSVFFFTVKTESVSTGNGKRDDHLRSPDFFNAKQFPDITFKSTAVAKGDNENEFEVTGDLTMKGVTSPITVTMRKTGEGADRRGNQKIGFGAEFDVDRTKFGMDFMTGPGKLGSVVHMMTSFEAVSGGN